jgi:hypothetical protein
MEAEKARAIKEAYWEAALYMNFTLTPQQFQMYCDDLIDEDADAVVQALRVLRREPNRRKWGVPQPSEVIAYLHPRETSDTQADSIASEILRNICPIGYNKPEVAEQKLSPQAWRVVVESGGWVSLCQRLRSDNLTTERAQLRDLARSTLRREEIAQRAPIQRPVLARAPVPVVPMEPKPAHLLEPARIPLPSQEDEFEKNKKKVAAIINLISGRA